MPIVAYYGNPGRSFGRVEFPSWDAARIAAWNDGALFDLHDTDERTTCWDRVWDSYEESPRQHEQLALPFDKMPAIERTPGAIIVRCTQHKRRADGAK